MMTPAQQVQAAAARRDRARTALDRSVDDLRTVVLDAVEGHGITEVEAARLAGVARTTVRRWRAATRTT